MTDYLALLPPDQQHFVRRAADGLKRQFEGVFGPETVERLVADSLQELLPTATVMTFLPVLAERFAKDRLRALAKVEGLAVSER